VPLSPCQLFGATWHSEFQRLRNGLDQVLASHLTMCLGCVTTILLLARIQHGENSDRALAATGQYAVQMRVHAVSRTEVRAAAPIPNGMAARRAHPREEVPTPEHNLCDNHSTDDNRAGDSPEGVAPGPSTPLANSLMHPMTNTPNQEVSPNTFWQACSNCHRATRPWQTNSFRVQPTDTADNPQYPWRNDL